MADNNARGSNLTQEDRARGGRESAKRQVRDERGQFAGIRGKKTEEKEKKHAGESRAEQGEQKQQQGNNQGREQGEQ